MKRCLTILLLAALLGACSSGEANTTSTTQVTTTKVRVVTTTPVLTDFTRVLGADLVEVYGLVKPGVDPHDFEPSPADITALARANLIVTNGMGLESWLAGTIDASESRAIVVDVSEGVIPRKNLEGEIDPHIWHNPSNAKIMTRNLRTALERVDPSHASVYASTDSAYAAQLDALDREIRQSLGRLVNKKVVTNHDSLGYYIDAYKLDFVGAVIPSFDTSTELSAAEVAALVTKIKAEKVPAIFAESSLPPTTAQTIAREANVKIVQGEDALYGDSLGPAGSPGATYLEMERHNTSVLVNNLG